MVELLRPEQPGIGLADNGRGRSGGFFRHARRVKLIGFSNAIHEYLIEVLAKRPRSGFTLCTQTKLDGNTSPRRHVQLIPSGGFGAGVARVDGFLPPVDDTLAEGILDVGSGVRALKKLVHIAFVFSEEKRRWLSIGAQAREQVELSECFVRGHDRR